MKRLFIKIYLKLLYMFLSLIYDKKYLRGSFFNKEYYTNGWSSAIRFWYPQKIQGINKDVPWPCCPQCRVVRPENITFDVNYIDNFFNMGCYFQAIGKITIGKRTQIAPNVGIITSNHDLLDIDKHMEPKPVSIGDDCWIGMNSMLLPGVSLGNHTVVGAGSVVTKSFLEGNCVLAGNPARKIKELPKKY